MSSKCDKFVDIENSGALAVDEFYWLCDECGEKSMVFRNPESMEDILFRDGWVFFPPNTHQCPKCAKGDMEEGHENA